MILWMLFFFLFQFSLIFSLAHFFGPSWHFHVFFLDAVVLPGCLSVTLSGTSNLSKIFPTDPCPVPSRYKRVSLRGCATHRFDCRSRAHSSLSLFNFSSFPDCCFQAFILTSVGTEKGLISLHCPVSPHCMGALYLCARCISVISRSRAPPPMTAHEVGPRIRFEWNYWLCIYNKIYRLVLISMQFGSVKDLLHLIRIQVYYYVYRLSPLPGFV